MSNVRLPEEYSVVQGGSILELSRNMRRAFEDGFEPLGGVSTMAAEHGLAFFFQAVVRYQDSPLPFDPMK